MKKVLLSLAAAAVVLPAGAALAVEVQPGTKVEVQNPADQKFNTENFDKQFGTDKNGNGNNEAYTKANTPAGKSVEKADKPSDLSSINGAVEAGEAAKKEETKKPEAKKDEAKKPAAKPVAGKKLPKTSAVK